MDSKNEKSITLINPAPEGYIAHPSPPLWVAYLQAILKKNGVRVRVIDMAAGMPIENIDTQWVGMTVMTPIASAVFSLADSLRAKGIKVVLGGPHASIMPDECLKHCDKVILSEGENCIDEIFDSNERKIKKPLIENLDSISFPCWDGLPLEKYASETRKGAYLSVLTSRGCPFQCIYCYKGIYGPTYRMRSAKNVVDEIQYLVEKYSAKEIAFIDDNMTANKNRTREICNLIIERGIKIAWSCPNGVRVDGVDAELLSLMKRAGCYQLSFGIESGNQEVLKKIGKHITLEQVRAAIAGAKKAGIQTIGFFMIALPFDTEETMQQTIDFAKELDPGLVQFTITTPYPGTKLYDLVAEQGKFIITDFSKYGSYSGKCYYEINELDAAMVERMYKKALKSTLYNPRYVLKRIIKNPKLIFAGLKYIFSKKSKSGD